MNQVRKGYDKLLDPLIHKLNKLEGHGEHYHSCCSCCRGGGGIHFGEFVGAEETPGPFLSQRAGGRGRERPCEAYNTPIYIFLQEYMGT